MTIWLSTVNYVWKKSVAFVCNVWYYMTILGFSQGVNNQF